MMKQAASQGRTNLYRLVVLAVGLTAWAAALAGSLQLHRGSDWLGHNICGPWGCAARPEALAGYHLFLTLLIVPTTVLVTKMLSPRVGQRLGGLLMAAGLLIGFSLAGHAAWEWLAGDDAQNPPKYTVHRAAFVIATAPDWPAIPLTLAGAVSLGVSSLGVRPRRTPGDPRLQSRVVAVGSQETP